MSMQITIDPMELLNTAVLLGTSAVELADVGSTLRSCTSCAMPPELRTSIDDVVATADRVLDEMAGQLRSQAGDLARRAVLAANDMLTAAGYPPLPGTTTANAPVMSGPGIVGGVSFSDAISTSPGSTGAGIVGGVHFGSVTILNPDGSPAVPMAGTSIVGGISFSDAISTSPGATGSAIIGGGGSYSGFAGMMLAGAQRQQDSQERLMNALKAASASGASFPASTFPMPGALSLSDIPSMTNPILRPSEGSVIRREEDRTGKKIPYLTPFEKEWFGVV